MKKILLLGLVCFGMNVQAQKFCEFNVYFETAQAKILPGEKKRIDSVLNTIGKDVKFNVKVTGHTDKRGSKEYNQRLSEKRANAVTNYITQKISHRELNSTGKAFTHLAYTGDDIHAFGKNRRVKVELYYTLPDVESIGAEKLEKEKFVTDNSVNDTLLARSGTRIFIPADGFVFEDGTPVSGNIEIDYIEYRDPIDFILGGIPMSHTENGEAYIFNSSGMFKMEGSQGGKKILIMEGKEIGLDFAKTQDVPHTNFYSFDTATQWTNLGDLDNANAHLADARNSCLFDDCGSLEYIGAEGMRLISSGKNIYSNLIANYSYKDHDVARLYSRYRDYRQRYKATQNILDSLGKEYQQTFNEYKLKPSQWNDENKTVKFTIECNNCNINPFAALESNEWEMSYKNKHWVKKHMDKKLVYCAISPIRSDGSTTIKIYDGKHRKKIILKDIRSVKPLTDNSKEGLSANFEQYRQSRKNIFKQRREIKALLEAGKNELDKSRLVIDSLKAYFAKPLLRVNNEVPQCFYKQSMRMVTSKSEKDMPELVWYRYFEKNPGLMVERYEPLSDPQVLKDSCERFRKRDSMKVARGEVLTRANSQFRNMQASLGISNFGVYNCDQLQRIKNPVEIMAAYQDEDENTMEIAAVFMIDHSINSVLTFNGYLDLWPNKFSYGANSKNTLVAFDEKGRAWICKPEDFAMAVKKPDEVKVFPLKKISKDATKQEILALVK